MEKIPLIIIILFINAVCNIIGIVEGSLLPGIVVLVSFPFNILPRAT